MILLIVLGLLNRTGVPADAIGQPVDIALSAYQYRADRRPDANPPESWVGLMHYANLPLNKPVDLKNGDIRRALCGLLWEEIRPIQTLELTWAASAKRRPTPSDLQITALMNQGASSSWWNNLAPTTLSVTPIVSSDGNTYTYPISENTCGLVVSVSGAGDASRFEVPTVRVLVPDLWKKMDLTIEWGFDKGTSGNDYSGRIETYDGRISELRPIEEDAGTAVDEPVAWQSKGRSTHRRGVKLSLLYMGTAKWRKVQQFTTQADDVARTIVTVWTKSGNFSFLAADLENGPILAPEYGFFVRRTSPSPTLKASAPQLRVTPKPLSTKMASIGGSEELKGWGSNDTPWFGSNATDHPVSTRGITIPPKSVAMHPGEFVDVDAEWTSPISGVVSVKGRLTHAQAGSNGIEWWIAHDTPGGRQLLGHGVTHGSGSMAVINSVRLDHIPVETGERLSLVLGNNGDYHGDTTIIDLTIAEIGGQSRSWNLAKDVGSSPDSANPHPDALGNDNVWRFCSEAPMLLGSGFPSEPPIRLASSAPNANAFEEELRTRGLQTIREQTRAHSEQTWLGAVTAMRGANLPTVPNPPIGKEPKMLVEVPSEAMTAQWNLGAWHLLRHCATNPKTGKLWFNDFPYGILAEEDYLILSVLDKLGESQASEPGFDQWLSLPLDRDHPVGLFTDGHGAMTYAEGPPGVGGNMDGIHAFGAGAIGWAMAQHYWMTGDTNWLNENAPRILASAEWMIRQRHTISNAVPGGARMWSKGLEPPLQVTPDSGGLWMNFYEAEAYYWSSIEQFALALKDVNSPLAPKLLSEAEAYRIDLKAAVDRSIALSPVVPVRDGTFHSVIPFACYVRGEATGAWGWRRDGSGTHVGQLYWDTVQSAAGLISPAGLLSPKDVRVQGWLDVLEDRVLLENKNVGNRDWFDAGWQYQMGLERTSNIHLAGDDIAPFLRSFLNGYAVDILPNNGYVFNEHAVHGPPDKIFEEAAFLERFRDMLVMEDGRTLWLARGTPLAWFEQGKHIVVAHAPSRFGEVGYEIDSKVAKDTIRATVKMPSRNPPDSVRIRIRHPEEKQMTSVLVNGQKWTDFDAKDEVVRLHGFAGTVSIEVRY